MGHPTEGQVEDQTGPLHERQERKEEMGAVKTSNLNLLFSSYNAYDTNKNVCKNTKTQIPKQYKRLLLRCSDKYESNASGLRILSFSSSILVFIIETSRQETSKYNTPTQGSA